MPTPDFVFLNRQAVRATSLNPTGEGGYRLVVVARGEADRDRLMEVLRDPGLVADLGDGEARPIAASGIEVHTHGEGSQALHRVEVVLTPISSREGHAAPDASVEDRLDTIIGLLTEIRDALKQSR